MQKISLIVEDTVAAVAFGIGVALALATLHIDEQPMPRPRIYSTSFMKFPAAKPIAELSMPLNCDATVTGSSPGEVPRTRCYVLKSKRAR